MSLKNSVKIGAKKIFNKYSLFVLAGITAMSFNVMAANINLKDPGSNATGNGSAASIVDVFTSGTNTTHTQVVELQGIEDIYVSFHCPANGVVIGTATFGIEESIDGTTWGSITATEMTQSTNTLFTSNVYGSNTTDIFSGLFRGTHTSTFVGTLGTSTALTNNFYHIKPFGGFLRTQCSLTSTGTDTVKYKILMRKGVNMNQF